MDYDVIVLGAGGMGSSAAAELARRGLRVLGLEQFGAAHDRGSSHGESRIVRQAYFESPAYIPLLRRAYALWDALPPELRIHRVGCLTLGSSSSPVITGAVASARQWGIALAELDRAEISARYPQFRPAGDDVGLLEADAGWVRPEATVRWYVELARALGATILERTPVTSWTVEDRGVRVGSGEHSWQAAKLVLAAGAWTPVIAAPLGLPIRVERRVMYFFQPVPGVSLGGLPTYIWDLADGDAIYGFPDDGLGAKVGFHDRGPLADPDSVQPGASEREENEMRAVLAERLPALAGRLLRSVGCLYALTPDAGFLLGIPAGWQGRVVLAAGFSGHGFKFVPVIGEVVADLVTDGQSGLDIGFLHPDRFA